MQRLSEIIATFVPQFAPKTNFESKESNKHRLAKKLVYDWLCELEEQDKKYANLKPFSWRIGGGGVHQELPIFETSAKYYFEHSYGVLQPGKSGSFEDCFDKELYLGKALFVPDITIFEKGHPRYFVEIVHTSSVSPAKKLKMKFWSEFVNCPFEVYEISADWVLDYVGQPEFLRAKLICQF